MNSWIRRYELTPSRNCNTWYFSMYWQPRFVFKIRIDKWTIGVWIFGIGIAFEKFPF